MSSTRTVFRTVVIAGAMLGTPIVVLADQGPSQPPAKNAPVDKKGPAPTTEPTKKPASPGPIDKAPTNKAPTDKAPAKNKPVDKPAGQGSGSGSAARPRAASDRPVGRGFVLA